MCLCVRARPFAAVFFLGSTSGLCVKTVEVLHRFDVGCVTFNEVFSVYDPNDASVAVVVALEIDCICFN